MAQTVDEIDTAIVNITKAMDPDDIAAAYLEQYASAVRQLAEARAWLSNPSSSHSNS